MLNKLLYQGRMVSDAELKQAASGIDFTEFTIAWSEKYKEVETKCFMRCKAWRNTAKFISEYFKKGQEILIEGRMETESWEKDGEKKSRTICLIEKANFCGSKSDNSGSVQTNTAGADSDGFMNIADGADEELSFA